MSTSLRIEDGTEFTIYVAASGRAIVTGFKAEGLEKLLNLRGEDSIEFAGEEYSIKDAYQRIGPIATYVPNLRDYLLVCNKL